MSPPDRDSRPGLGSSLRRIGATLLTLLHTRAELVAVEFEEEVLRLGLLTAHLVAALFLFGLALVMATGLVLLICPEQWRLELLGAMALLYAALGGWVWWRGNRVLLAAKRPFSATVGELARDADFVSRQ